jgi:hypothetical protein
VPLFSVNFSGLSEVDKKAAAVGRPLGKFRAVFFLLAKKLIFKSK